MPSPHDQHLSNLSRVATAAGPILALATDYPPGHHIPAHSHDRGQLLHALTGAVLVAAEGGRWVVPPDHALWIPAHRVHAVDAIGLVRMRSVYIHPLAAALPPDLRVVAITPLMRALIVEAVALPEAAATPRDRVLIDLLLREIPRLEPRPLALPIPEDPRLADLCRRFLIAPGPRAAIDTWAAAAGMSRRSFTRAFRRQTGLGLDQWRQQALLFAALPRLAQGTPVTTVALDLGYDSVAAFTTMFRRILGASPRAYLARGA